MRNEKVRVEGARGVRATKLGLLIEVDVLDDAVWVPQSLIDDDSEVWRPGDEGVLVIPRWLAEEKGLV